MQSDANENAIGVVEVYAAEEPTNITKQVHATSLVSTQSASPSAQQHQTPQCSCPAAAADCNVDRLCGPQVQQAVDEDVGELAPLRYSTHVVAQAWHAAPYEASGIRNKVAHFYGVPEEVGAIEPCTPRYPKDQNLDDSFQALVSTPCAGQSPVHVEASLSTLSIDQQDTSSQASPCTPHAGQWQEPFEADLPDDAGDLDVIQMHASSSPCRDRVPSGNLMDVHRPSGKRLSPDRAYMLRKDNTLQLNHGSKPSAKLGFAGDGPFWTCDREAVQSLRHRQQGESPPSGKSPPLMHAGGAESTATSTNWALSSITSHTKQVIDNCVDLLAGALNASADTAPPERELTTVGLESLEQRLLWREFLTESVSIAFARYQYCNFDVDAEPPQYARPPISLASAPSQNSGTSHVVPAAATCEPEKPQVQNRAMWPSGL